MNRRPGSLDWLMQSGLRATINTNFELQDTVAMLRDRASLLFSKLYALIVVQQDARQIAEAASQPREMVSGLLNA